MASADPNGEYYKQASKQITKAREIKEVFQKVIVDPTRVEINENYIKVDASEYYLHNDKPSIGNWTYQLQQIPEKSEWWIESSDSSYRQLNDSTGKFTKEPK